MRTHSPAFPENPACTLTPPHLRGSPRAQDSVPVGGAYLDQVPASQDARRDAFAQFVIRALAHAKETRGWSVPKIAQLSGLGDSTIYRWRDADWKSSPNGDQVAAFCNTLDIPVTAAFSILWPGKGDKPSAPRPLPMDPDFELLLRRLVDPNVPETEKFHIRETIRALAARATRSGRDAG